MTSSITAPRQGAAAHPRQADSPEAPGFHAPTKRGAARAQQGAAKSGPAARPHLPRDAIFPPGAPPDAAEMARWMSAQAFPALPETGTGTMELPATAQDPAEPFHIQFDGRRPTYLSDVQGRTIIDVGRQKVRFGAGAWTHFAALDDAHYALVMRYLHFLVSTLRQPAL